MISVLIADDHDIYRHGLSMLLHSDERFIVVGQAKDGNEALAMIQQHAPDVAVLDLSMPGAGAIEIVAQLEAEKICTNSIIVTTHGNADCLKRSLDAGAKGFLPKDASYRQLTEAIELVYSGKVCTGVIPPPAGIVLPAATDLLSRRERDILRCVGEGLTSKMIGDKLCISHRTVDSHRMNIMQKLSIHNASGLVKFALEHDF